MNHGNLKHLMEAQNSLNNKLYSISRNVKQPDDLLIDFWSGARITSHPDSSWELHLVADHLSVQAMEALNLTTNTNFVLKKHKARHFSINGIDFLGAKTHLHFSPKGTCTYVGGVIRGEMLATQRKELHKLTRRIRKKVQPQLRLLGTGHFQKKEKDRDLYWSNNAANEIKYLIQLLDGENIVEALDKLRVVCEMDYLFGNGERWSNNQVSDFNPKKIIDKILRRVGVHQIAILEKYDERSRSNTN
jgi:hypothetical protein